MPKIFVFAFLLSFIAVSAAQAQGLQVDDGIRNARSVIISGNSVIDDETVDDDLEADFKNSNPITDEETKMLQGTGIDSAVAPSVMLPENPVMPIEPYSPSAPKKNVKRVVKPYEQMKIRRSIQDERIDDYYVQEMVKDNYLFTPDMKHRP